MDKFLNENGLKRIINKIDLQKANLESPSFSGVPTAPTAETTNNSNQIATTGYVQKVASKLLLDSNNAAPVLVPLTPET